MYFSLGSFVSAGLLAHALAKTPYARLLLLLLENDTEAEEVVAVAGGVGDAGPNAGTNR